MTKTQARALARLRLAELAPGERAAAGVELARRVWTVPEVTTARVLLLYASLPAEAPTDPIAAEARSRGITVVYPRCIAETRAMTLHRVGEAEALLDAGRYGIREPDLACPLVELGEVDAVLVPGLAWDRAGGRLGRGGGYFDRLFADPRWRGFRCGLFFAAQEMDLLPTDPWDAPLHAVVTERELWRPGRQS